MDNILTLSDVHESLTVLGYEATLSPNCVVVKVGGLSKPFPAVITHNQMNRHFQFTCQLTKLGLIPEDKLAAFALAALDANSRIAPFAYALLTDSDDPKKDKPEDWQVVLTHSIPLGDFSRSELASAMESLLTALVDSGNVMNTLKAKL
jgi:hypothetical protein